VAALEHACRRQPTFQGVDGRVVFHHPGACSSGGREGPRTRAAAASRHRRQPSPQHDGGLPGGGQWCVARLPCSVDRPRAHSQAAQCLPVRVNAACQQAQAPAARLGLAPPPPARRAADRDRAHLVPRAAVRPPIQLQPRAGTLLYDAPHYVNTKRLCGAYFLRERTWAAELTNPRSTVFLARKPPGRNVSSKKF
jgi:hypothetical protein